MKKRFLSVLMTLLLLMSSVAVFAEETTYTISLENAINMAMEDNPQFVSADAKIKNAEKQVEKAKKDQKNVKGFIRLPANFALVPVKNGYYVEQARIGVESAKREKVKSENALRYDVTQKYYSVKLAEALLSSVQDTYKITEENKKAIDIQFGLGMVSQLDVDNAEYALMQTKAACEKYERNLDVAEESLKIALQIDGQDVKLNLTDGIEFTPFETNVEEDVENAMESRLDVYMLKSTCEQAEKYLKATSALGNNSAEYSAANQTLIQNQYTYTNSKKMIGLSIIAAYNDILNAADSVHLAERNVELKTQEYNVAKIQYDIGMITNTQLTGALSAVTSAKIELENAKLTYKLAVEKYSYEITLGL